MRTRKSAMTKTPLPLPWLLLSMFACGYLLSTLLRGVTAALAPYFTQEFSVTPAELGLLAGSYFFGFALLQLPIGMLLDRYGVRLVLVWSLLVAALSCLLFALASSYHGLFWSRFLCGIGVSAAYIAPLTAARLWASHALQQRINAWLLMTGSLGLVLGTLPAESLASYFGWRSVFLILSGSFALLSISIAVIAPPHKTAAAKIPKPATISKFLLLNSYLPIVKSPIIWRVGVLVVINYAILVALQTLWVGPWLTNLSGETTRGASIGLLYINFLTLVVFLIMGYLSPGLMSSPQDAEKLLKYGTLPSIAVLAWIAYLGADANWYHFAAFCVIAWPISVTHPLIGQHFPPDEAGRAIAFINLLLFVGVFAWQSSFGVMISALSAPFGLTLAYQLSLLVLIGFSVFGFGFFWVFHQKDSAEKPIDSV